MATPDPDATLRVDTDVRFARRYESDAQFAPGTLVAERYRISSILGKGGMGEVYRADDIKLGQTVALKFLPAKLALDAKLLDRLHDEVRLGRQITHPNVCRIYDIGEWGDAHFVAMEYIDGEDLARLLHRIGRLPHDKAVDITRGIAAGLAAAHAKGILHRDLKPANVLIDSHGDPRITDFGLALTANDEQHDVAGTPAYMAPELFDGAPATIQSDLYALGLVMYEIFTGKRLFTGKDKSTEVTTPSSVVRDIEPAVERVILRCLERDPAQRPRSAREVIESLPGGDPLAAALAAGETPSPKLVAAAGTEGSLRPRVAWSLLAAAAIVMLTNAGFWRSFAMDRYMAVKSPEVLRERAAELLKSLSIPARGEPVVASRTRGRYLNWLSTQHQFDNDQNVVRYGPALLVAHLRYGTSEREVAAEQELVSAPGRTTLDVDAAGRLAFLEVGADREWPARAPAWTPLLQAAGFDVRGLHATAPAIVPPVPFDARAAWTGTYPRDRVPVRVEAAMWRGTPVFLRISGAWDAPNVRTTGTFGDDWKQFIFGLGGVIALASVLLAARNLRLRRGDRQGAFRIAVFMFILLAGERLLSTDLVGGFGDVLLYLVQNIAMSLLGAVVAFLLYVALEPYARRRWPDKLIAWTRLLAGRVRDPMVGRDVLIGIVGGALHVVVPVLTLVVGAAIAGQDPGPKIGSLERVLDVRHALASLLGAMWLGIAWAFVAIAMLVLFTIVLRKRSFAVAAFSAVFIAIYTLAVAGTWWVLPFALIVALLNIVIAVRYGLLAYAAMVTVFFAIFFVPPLTASWAVWLVALPFVVVLLAAIWAFRVSLGGQSPWHPALLDD